jgi:hypothetical protein
MLSTNQKLIFNPSWFATTLIMANSETSLKAVATKRLLVQAMCNRKYVRKMSSYQRSVS